MTWLIPNLEGGYTGIVSTHGYFIITNGVTMGYLWDVDQLGIKYSEGEDSIDVDDYEVLKERVHKFWEKKYQEVFKLND